ncbi:MAG: site-specific integrase [Hyphomicrobium sp.]
MAEVRLVRITKTLIGQLAPGDILRDADVKGFGARRQQDSVSYFVKTRINGRQKWITIGRHGSPWTPETARKEALRILADASAGKDPSEAKRKARIATTVFEDVADQFLTVHGRKLKPTTREVYGYLVRLQLVPTFGRRRIDEITRGDVANFHSKWSDKPRTANHALSVLSKIMSWAEQQGLRAEHSNPCLGIDRYREQKRERFLIPYELATLGRTLDAAERENSQNTFVIAAIRLLILTGARLGEILTLKWEHIDHGRRLILLPDSKTGAKPIPLNQPALDILANMPRVQGNPYVCVGHRKGEHLVNIQKPWRDICKTAGLTGVRLHDLRHSFASVAVAAGGSLPILGKVLGHTQPQTTARYAHLGDNPITQLSEATAAQIARSMRGYTAGQG